MHASPDPSAHLLDAVRPAQIACLAATLGLGVADLPADGALPPLWHWMLFPDAAPATALGLDGHRATGGLVQPPAGLPRRMWAGGRLRFAQPVWPGDTLRRDSDTVRADNREGRSGRLHFVTVRHRLHGAAGLLIEEEQDVVYRAAAGGSAPAPAVAAPAAAPAAAHRRHVTPDAVMLFRFSALTFNSHRIHYDRDFACAVEHYPDLVVHGPLQAILLADLLRRAHPAARLRAFSFRGVAPAFAGRALALEAWPETATPTRWQLRSRDESGAICTSAQAELG